jgi:HK97 family phage major capsid protein
MNRIASLKAKHAETLAAMQAINTAADANTESPGILNAEQRKQYEALNATLGQYATAITEASALQESERTVAAVVPASSAAARVTVGKHRSEDDAQARGFGSPKEFLAGVLANRGLTNRADVSDERLRSLAVLDRDDKAAGGELAFMLPLAYTPRSLKATVGSDEQGEYDDRYGGFAMQTTRLAGMLQVGFEGDPTAGRTQAIPMQTPAVEIEARTDKTHTSSVSGGFTVARRAEAAAAAASRGQMEMITLKAASLFGFNYTTEELLADSPATVVALVQRGFETQFPAHMLNEKIRGLGGDQFVGVTSSASACTISITKETNQAAATINATNAIKMAARCWGLDNAIWLANHDTRPQLMTLAIAVGTGGALIYTPSARVGFPDMLLGRPIFYTEFCAALGTVGDLILANFSQYLEGLYQPLQSAESMHVRFVNHERAFKFWLRNAGAPWWRTALTPNQSSATLSPFITLATRA